MTLFVFTRYKTFSKSKCIEIKHFSMMKMIFILSIMVVLFSGCATIIGGKTNTLVFSEESLPEAEVFIDGVIIGNAPGKIKVSSTKIQHGSKLSLKADGFMDQEFILLRKQSAIYTVVDLVTGIFPLVVDFSNGAIYRPRPRKFEYELLKISNPKQAQK